MNREILPTGTFCGQGAMGELTELLSWTKLTGVSAAVSCLRGLAYILLLHMTQLAVLTGSMVFYSVSMSWVSTCGTFHGIPMTHPSLSPVPSLFSSLRPSLVAFLSHNSPTLPFLSSAFLILWPWRSFCTRIQLVMSQS